MLKPLDQLTTPDILYARMSGRTGSPIVVAEHHDAVATIEMLPQVPEPVVQLFDRARNAFLYSWFVAELQPVAEAQAYFALERALREKLNEPQRDRGPTLFNLVEMAVSRKYLFDDPAAARPSLALLLSKLRNNWSHGSSDVNGWALSLTVLRMCADSINQLFA